MFERGGVRALGVQLEVAALQAAVGFGQAILEQAFEAGLGVALLRAAAFVLFDAAFAAAQAVVEQQPGEGERGGDDGAAADRVPEEVGVHARCAPSAANSCAQDREHRTHVLSIVRAGSLVVQYPEQTSIEQRGARDHATSFVS